MDNDELIAKLESSSGEGEDTLSVEEEIIHKLLIFQIDDRKYAVYADLVKEIVINHDLYFIPFVPPYITGLINRQGQPYTVFDLKMLFTNERLQASKVMIMKSDSDFIAFMITDVAEISGIPSSGINLVVSSETESTFIGSCNLRGEEIFIINVQEIYNRLANDLQNI
ncbi:MAG TPA: chemotaxis protein CheW [Spirochaetota bacterium]|nr:chemotaxis protein CheW [Spirochaetota bacterium]HPQ53207.1 chemotaxis protein CheW [Spirochaetota bacterium]